MLRTVRSMCGVVCGLWMFLAAVNAWSQDGTYADPESAAADPDFQLQGEYTATARGIQVVAQGDGEFLVVSYRGGLPGAGWDGSPKEEIDEDTDGVKGLIEAIGLKKVHRESPTLGTKPPAGAVVLFDGTKESLAAHWKEGARISDDGLLMEGVTSTDMFQDFSLHIEFRTPFMPKARGQGRGNSGVYYQGRYETQVLDSFGLAGKNNETGGIYEISDPALNMCFPPLSWQTYDAIFTAARWDDSGKKITNARLTVRLNGVTVQQDVELPRITRAAPVQESAEPGPIYLQNHGNPIRYRNIWVLPRDVEKEARRPFVPAFERFHAQGADPFSGGQLLAGELACAKCHSDQGTTVKLHTRQAPILTKVGDRVRPEWIEKFLTDPHSTKPGTTMPAFFQNWSPEERDDAIRKLTNFLVSTGKFSERTADVALGRKGEKLFHEIGCTACHAPRNGQAVNPATSVPLTGIDEKYSLNELVEFLKNPHSVRPSGRMPQLQLRDKEPEELAHYLMSGVKAKAAQANVTYATYKGSWNKVPNFDSMTPVKTGECAAFDVYVAGQTDDFGVRYEGFLKLDRDGKYTFHVGSDDGSILYIDGKRVADADGIHPHSYGSGSIDLKAGTHKVRIDYFEQGGQESLALEFEGPGVSRQDAARLLTKSADPPAKTEEPVDPNAFVFDASLVGPGRELFSQLGCAACHELKQGNERIAPKFADGHAPQPLAKLASRGGCLAGESKLAPNFDLAPLQTAAINTLLNSATTEAEPSPSTAIQHTLASFNCLACHQRDGVGGPEVGREALFTSTIPEMGDEGRLPPTLNGVGDKLNDAWLKQILHNGATDRSYMKTRMPKFANGDVDALASQFVERDRRTELQPVAMGDPEHRIKSTGRTLVGDKGLSCIKCHIFGPHKATGIQAIPLTSMTRRLREDWFRRYLLDPQQYRPGTRMPSGFPNGVSAVPDIYEGDPARQMVAIWTFLEDGDKAGIPDGLIAEMIELKPEKSPIIYRNFIEGTSPRGIAVGYPGKVHMAWDANDLCWKLIWHGRFMDASRHWNGRGQGRQGPLGDHIMPVEPNAPIGVLASLDTPWTEGDPRERGYKFLGYRLDEKDQPVFRYSSPVGTVEDFPQPIPNPDQEGTFKRQLTITGNTAPDNVWFRAAVDSKITPASDGWYQLSTGVRVRVTGAGEPVLRDSNGKQELLVPVQFKNGTASLTQELFW